MPDADGDLGPHHQRNEQSAPVSLGSLRNGDRRRRDGHAHVCAGARVSVVVIEAVAQHSVRQGGAGCRQQSDVADDRALRPAALLNDQGGSLVT